MQGIPGVSKHFIIPYVESRALANTINLAKEISKVADKISGKLLKELAIDVAAILIIIISASLIQGAVPTHWNEALVILLFKRRDQTNTFNYRPISLTYLYMADGMNFGNQIIYVLLDLSKAFDKVPEKCLFKNKKFEYYGIRSGMLKWIASFLQNLMLKVVPTGKFLNTSHVISGVPKVH